MNSRSHRLISIDQHESFSHVFYSVFDDLDILYDIVMLHIPRFFSVDQHEIFQHVLLSLSVKNEK